jgi:DNA-binding protein HU-beta
MTVNKNDLVAAVSGRAGLSKSDSAKAVDSVFDSIADALKAGEEVRIVGFGSFNVTRRKQSQGRNPRTGEPITIPASNQPKFKAGKGLKDAATKNRGGRTLSGCRRKTGPDPGRPRSVSGGIWNRHRVQGG